MIKIKDYSPINNFARSSWEFYDEHLVEKIKSLIINYDNEVRFENIKFINSRSIRNLRWIWISFITITFLGLISLGLNHFCITNPTIEIIKKIIASLSLSLLIPVWVKYEYYSFLDANKNFLSTIRVNKKTKHIILEAIKLVKQKTELISESYYDGSLPNNAPVFQFSEFDFADYLNNSKVFVYDDKIIDVEKSLTEEVTSVIRFDELSGKTKVMKMGNDQWDNISSYWLFIMCIAGISVVTFFADQLRGINLDLMIILGGFVLLIPMLFLKYVKSEILVFYDKQDKSVFWTRVNSSNREKLNQIVEFVKGKVESQK